MHLGHLRVYSISDLLSRYNKISGKKVFCPQGWDSFGLPAENASIKNKTTPLQWTTRNIKEMKQDMKEFTDFDWSSVCFVNERKYQLVMKIITNLPKNYFWNCIQTDFVIAKNHL